LFLTDCCYQAIQPRVGDINGKLMDTVDYEIDSITI
jgi:hypothetical protein